MFGRRCAFAVAGLLCACSAQAGGVYKWTDAHGTVHYDDKTLIEGQRLTREYIAQRIVRDQPDWVGVVPAEFAAEVQIRCTAAQERLGNFRSALQLYGRDPSGNVYLMSTAQTRLLILETERDAQRYCAADAPRRLLAERRAQLREADTPLGY